MSPMDWIAAAGLFVAFAVVIVRTEILNPRFEGTPCAPYLERLAWDALALTCALRGIMLVSDVVQATGSEAALSAALAIVATIGLAKTLFYAIAPKVIAVLFDSWG